jgi:hypothetical protein
MDLKDSNNRVNWSYCEYAKLADQGGRMKAHAIILLGRESGDEREKDGTL